MNIKFALTSLIIAMLIVACSKIETDTPDAPSEIGFSVEGIAPVNRASSQFNDGASFGVLAYTCPTGVFNPDINLPNLLYNAYVEKYTSEGVPGYRYIPTAHWPLGASTKVQFAAYYPHNSSIAPGAITVSPFTSPGLPKIDIVMGLEKGSLDFATSVVGPISRVVLGDPVGTPFRNDDYVNFHFKRHMSYISFRAMVIGLDPALFRLYINTITLRNIYRKGTFNLATQAWENTGIDGTTGATLKLTSTGIPVSTIDFKDVSDPSKVTTLSVIPQIYDNVELTVNYTIEYLKPDGGCEHRIFGSKIVPITIDWTAGKQHIYDFEFAFFEVYGDDVLFNFQVKPWKVVNVGTEM